MTSARSCTPLSDTAASCRPAIHPSVRSASASTSADVRSRPIDPVEELPCLGLGEPEVGGAQLGELATAAEPGQRQRRVGAGGDHQVQLARKVVEQERHRLVHRGRADGVVVVEHQHPLLPRRLLPGARDVVDECGQGRRDRRGAQRLEDGPVDLEADAVQGRHHVRQEARQVVVTLVQRQPPDAGVRPAPERRSASR